MTSHDLGIALVLVSEGKEFLAADETVATLTHRLDALRIDSTDGSGRAYRVKLRTFVKPPSARFGIAPA